jgi:hypothetical protein
MTGTLKLLLIVVIGPLMGLVGIPDALAQVQPNADTQGSQVFERAIAAAGGRQAWKELKDFRASGTFSLYSGGEVVDSGNAALAGTGLKRFRLTATLSHETRTWLWKDGSGLLSAGNTHSSTIGRHNLATLEGITLPVQKLVGLLDGPSRSIQLVESALIDGTQAYRLRMVRTATDRKETNLLGRPSFTTDFIVDQQTFLIIAIEDTIYPNASTSGAFQHRVRYGDFRSVAGLQVPFSVKEEISGQFTWGLQLESFEANVGLTGSEFDLQ